MKIILKKIQIIRIDEEIKINTLKSMPRSFFDDVKKLKSEGLATKYSHIGHGWVFKRKDEKIVRKLCLKHFDEYPTDLEFLKYSKNEILTKIDCYDIDDPDDFKIISKYKNELKNIENKMKEVEVKGSNKNKLKIKNNKKVKMKTIKEICEDICKKENVITTTKRYVDSIKITDMFIGMRECRCRKGRIVRAKKEIPAQLEVKSQPAIPAKENVVDEDGNIIEKGHPGVAAIKGKAAVKFQPAAPGYQYFHVSSDDLKILEEAVARMADQGFYPVSDVKAKSIYKNSDLHKNLVIDYIVEDIKTLRKVFKKVKSKDFYNKPGYEKIQEKKAEEKVALKRFDKEKKKAEEIEKPKKVEKSKKQPKEKKTNSDKLKSLKKKK